MTRSICAVKAHKRTDSQTDRRWAGGSGHHAIEHALAGRRGVPDDIAAAVRFVCGPGAAFITGQNMQVNGGAFLG
jgi:NAD(P)-dependent dehydrogenase (short-subunit alcohol dehydrogenase family)